MKNVQVIDGGVNSIFEIYQISDEQFDMVFPQNTDIAFLDEVNQRIDPNSNTSFWNEFYSKQIAKPEVIGIHGTLHLFANDYVKRSFPNRCESDVL